MSLMDAMRQKWDRFARREKMLAAASVMIIVAVALDIGFIEPMLTSISTVKTVAETKQKELDGYVKQRKEMGAEMDALRNDPAFAGRANDAIEKAVSSGRLWDANSAARWFDMAVEAFGPELSQLSIANSGEIDTELKSFFLHEISLQAKSDWAKVERFMRAQGSVAALKVERVEVSSDVNGRITLLIRARAASAEKVWKGTRELSMKKEVP